MVQPLNSVEMKIPAKPEFVGIVRLTVSGIANRLGFHFEAIEDLKIAISEAITNTVQHAYRKDHEGEVLVNFSMYEDRLETVVADCGESFDITKKNTVMNTANPKEMIRNLREGGFGLHLIEALMDKVDIQNDSGVIVTMTKFFPKNEVGRNDDQISTSP